MEEVELKLFELKKANELAVKLYSKQSYLEASKLFLRSADLAKELNEANIFMVQSWTKAAKCSIKTDQPTKGLVLLEKCLKAIEKLVQSDTHELAGPVWKHMALCSAAIGDYEEAQNCIEKAINIRKNILKRDHPSFFKLYSRLGFYCFKLEKFSEAAKHFSEAIDIAKQIGLSPRILFGVYSNAGSAHEKLNQLSLASENYKLAIQSAKGASMLENEKNEVAVALYKQGSLLLKEKKPMEAVKSLEEALGLIGQLEDSENIRSHVLVNLISALIETGDLEKAEKLTNELMSKFEKVEKGNNVFCGLGHNLKGVLKGKKGEVEGVHSHFEKSFSILSKLPDLPFGKEVLGKIKEGMTNYSGHK